jgi:WD40 repeat protein/serine/threonine protein kinase
MTSDHWQRVREIFDAVSEQPPSERAALLESASGDDEVLRAEVEKLLRAHDRVADFLEESPLVAVFPKDIPDTEAIGRRIGPYQVVGEIARGGMGVVYKAVRADDEYQKQVAIKLVWPGTGGEKLLQRFRQERQILAQLEHPNIARLLDGGTTAEGWPYVVMEYVAGVPMTAYCDAHRLSITERLQLFRTVCAAVQYAHQNLIIHRDLKPDNILVTEDGTVKLLDFGIAKLLDTALGPEAAKLTRTGWRLMTPAYASPEQVRGETMTTASDVYSLGVVLYELLTGHRPFRLKGLLPHEAMRMICEEEPKRPSQAIIRTVAESDLDGQRRSTHTPEAVSRMGEGSPERLRARLQGDLDNIVLMALRKEPQQRYASVEQFSEDIARHLAGQPVIARKGTLSYRASKFIRRHKVGVTIATLALLALILGLVLSVRQARLAEEQARWQRRLLYAVDMRQAGEDWYTGNLARMEELVERHLPKPGEADWRGFEWYYLWRLLHRDRIRLHHANQVRSMTFHPNGRQLVTGGSDGSIRFWDITTGQVITAPSRHQQRVRCIALSPDGRKLVTGDEGGIVKLWDAAGGRELAEIRPSGSSRIDSVAFSRDGKKFATGSHPDRALRLWDADTGQPLMTLQGHTAGIRAVEFSPDGRLIATGGGDGTVRLWDAHTGQARATLRGALPRGATYEIIHSVAFSPDGRLLAEGGLNSKVRIWHVATGRLLHTLTEPRGWILSLAFSPDSRHLAVSSGDKRVRLWEAAWEAATDRLRASFKDDVTTITFSPDGQWLAGDSDGWLKLWAVKEILEPSWLAPPESYKLVSVAFLQHGERLATGDEQGGMRLWEVETGREIAMLRKPAAFVNQIVLSPDGRHVATGSNDHTARLYDLLTGQELFVFKTQRPQVFGVAFSPDGAILAACGEDEEVRLWDTKTGRERLTLRGHTGEVETVAFSPDGRKLVSGGRDRVAKLWDTATGRELATLRGHAGPVLSVTFSPDGTKLATGSQDYAVKLWEAATGRELATLRGHGAGVYSLAFSPDARRLATGSSDGTVKLWDPETGQELLTLKEHNDQVRAVAFSPDGRVLASGGYDQTARLLRAASPQEVSAQSKPGAIK